MSEGQVQYVKNNFSSGELSQAMMGRLDVEKYHQGLQLGENVILLPQGGFTYAWGTQYVAEVKHSTKQTRLEKFRFSTEQAYSLEFGEGYIRFFRSQGQIGGPITNAVNNGSGLVRITSNAHGLTTGDTVYVSGVLGTTEATGFWTVTVINANTFDLVGSAYTNTYISGGKWVLEIQSLYLEADLFELQFVQSADVVYIFHESYKPRKLERLSNTTWKLTELSFLINNVVTAPWRGSLTGNTITMTPSGVSGAITLTASAPFFSPLHDGTYFKLKHGATIGVVVVDAYVSPTVLNAQVWSGPLGGTGVTSEWQETLWNDYRGYPRAGTIQDERLVAGGSPDDPATFVGSVTGKYEDMTVGINDDDAYQYTIGASEVGSILWIASGDPMLIGTPSGVFKVFGGSATAGAITPGNVTVRLQTTVGAAPVSPVTVASELFYLQNSKKKLRKLAYDLNADKLIAEDTTILSSHILGSGVKQMVYQAEPYELVWSVRNDGTLVAMTTVEQEKVRGFTRRFVNAAYAGLWESLTCIPAPDESFDQPWGIVLRTIQGQPKRYVEYMTVTDPLSPDVYSYLDCALTYEGAATNTVTGLSHLEGLTVGIVGDGQVYPAAQVVGGSVTLNGAPASKIRVGLIYFGYATTVPPEVNLADGPSTGRKKKLSNVKIRFLNTTGALIYSGALASVTAGEELAFVDADNHTDTAPPLFTGYKPYNATSYEDDGVLTIAQVTPLPMTVLSISGKLHVGDI